MVSALKHLATFAENVILTWSMVLERWTPEAFFSASFWSEQGAWVVSWPPLEEPAWVVSWPPLEEPAWVVSWPQLEEPGWSASAALA